MWAVWEWWSGAAWVLWQGEGLTSPGVGVSLKWLSPSGEQAENEEEKGKGGGSGELPHKRKVRYDEAACQMRHMHYQQVGGRTPTDTNKLKVSPTLENDWQGLRSVETLEAASFHALQIPTKFNFPLFETLQRNVHVWNKYPQSNVKIKKKTEIVRGKVNQGWDLKEWVQH